MLTPQKAFHPKQVANAVTPADQFKALGSEIAETMITIESNTYSHRNHQVLYIVVRDTHLFSRFTA